MKVLLAKQMGLCGGVDRALRLVAREAERLGELNTLGPVVHNPQVVQRLDEAGVRVVGGLDDVAQGAVAITSHGAPPEVMEEAARRGLEVVDTTCPFVRRAQMAAKELADAGFKLIIFGDAAHPEVRGIVGWAQGRALVIDSVEGLQADEARRFLVSARKLGVVAQTTQSIARFTQFVQALAERYLDRLLDLRVQNTICDATAQRQEAALAVAAQVDLMLVVGGKSSANTRRLAQLCADTGARTYHVEGVDELERDWFTGVERVGLTAGASTPDWVVKNVLQRLADLGADDVSR